MKITDMLARLEAADKAASQCGPLAVPVDSCSGLLHENGWDARNCDGRGLWFAHCHKREDAQLFAITRNALPGLLAWCREAEQAMRAAEQDHMVPLRHADLFDTLLDRDVPVLGEGD